jgi:DNA repair exonuclease SbcCD ATPase subunit
MEELRELAEKTAEVWREYANCFGNWERQIKLENAYRSVVGQYQQATVPATIIALLDRIKAAERGSALHLKEWTETLDRLAWREEELKATERALAASEKRADKAERLIERLRDFIYEPLDIEDLLKEYGDPSPTASEASEAGQEGKEC